MFNLVVSYIAGILIPGATLSGGNADGCSHTYRLWEKPVLLQMALA